MGNNNKKFKIKKVHSDTSIIMHPRPEIVITYIASNGKETYEDKITLLPGEEAEWVTDELGFRKLRASIPLSLRKTHQISLSQPKL